MTSLDRRGISLAVIIVALLVTVAVIGVVSWYAIDGRRRSQLRLQPVLTTAVVEPFSHDVLEQGEVESSSNTEIKCQVRSRNSGGVEILWVVPEGSRVKEGDLLVRLDSSALEQERDQQQITVNTSSALVVQAEANLAAAREAYKEYMEGTFLQEERTILNEIFEAQENLRRTQLSVRSTERLAARGLVTPLQVEADQFSVQKADNSRLLAELKLKVLREQTRERNRIQLDADIAAAQVKLENERKSHELEVQKLADLEEQIRLCELRAPRLEQEDAIVVYANIYSSRGNSEFVVEPGAKVREGQTVLRIPDATKMHVRAKINESRITLIRPGQPVTIRVDALGDVQLKGEVSKVNNFAEPSSYFSSNIKQYATEIRIHNPPPEIRPGLTAEVKVHVNRHSAALQLPVQAVFEQSGQTFVLLKRDSGWETRPVTLGASNTTTVMIASGLNAGEQVAMNPRGFRELLDLPEEMLRPTEAIAAEGIGQGFEQIGVTSAEGSPSDTGSTRPRRRAEQFGGGQAGGGQAGGGQAGGGQAGGGRAGESPPSAASLIGRLDTNGDGRLMVEELSEERRGRFASADTDGDGEITEAELSAQMSRLSGGPRGAGGGDGGGGE